MPVSRGRVVGCLTRLEQPCKLTITREQHLKRKGIPPPASSPRSGGLSFLGSNALNGFKVNAPSASSRLESLYPGFAPVSRRPCLEYSPRLVVSNFGGFWADHRGQPGVGVESAVIGGVTASSAFHCHTRIAGSFPALTHLLTAGRLTPSLRARAALLPATARAAWMSMKR
jgi:hypothetical protein